MAQVKTFSEPSRLDIRLAGVNLEQKYAEDLAEGHLERYAKRLAHDALSWWCEFETEKLSRHFSVLRDAGIVLPPRLGFLDEVLGLSLSQPGYLGWFERFLSEKDHNAAAVTVAAALSDIWLSGHDFRRAGPWLERAGMILQASPAPVALMRAAVLAYAGILELLGEAGITQARATFAACRKEADTAQSLPLRLFLASHEAYALIWSGDYAAAEVMLAEASALACRPDAPQPVGLYVRASLCLFLTLRGDVATARRRLREDLKLFEMARLPAIPWLTLLASLLQADAMEGDEVAVDALASRMRKRLVVPGKYFYHVMLHMAQGVADLLLGRPQLALAHARAARVLGDTTHSPVAQSLPALLEVQARADIGDNDGALALADAWMEKWRVAGLIGCASSAAVEMALALQRLGQPERARAALEHARGLLPAGESLLLFHRSSEYLSQALGLLTPPGRDTGQACEGYPVAIHALGELRVRVGARLLYDRDWRGERAKSLLKALLALGGHKVPASKLAHRLWPDADDEQARGNLKVALWRLRHLGTEQGESMLPWLLMRNGEVSLANGVVWVDALAFQETVESLSRRQPLDRQGLLRALDLYENDFLADDHGELWIIDHRLRLRELFLSTTRLLADHAGTREELEQSVIYLERSHLLDPLDERTSERLMACYLKLGYPGKALTFFRATEAAMARELGIRPGSALQQLAERARAA